MAVDKSRGFETFSGHKTDSPITDSECCDKLLACDEIRLRFEAECRSFRRLGTPDPEDEGDSLPKYFRGQIN